MSTIKKQCEEFVTFDQIEEVEIIMQENPDLTPISLAAITGISIQLCEKLLTFAPDWTIEYIPGGGN